MSYKISRNLLIVTIVLFVGSGIFAAGFMTGARYHALLPAVITPKQVVTLEQIEVEPQQGSTPEDLTEAFEPFWEAWELLHENFIDQPLDTQALVYGSIKGMMRATGDRHTGYMTPAEHEIMQADFSGELEGIGAEVDARSEHLRVISPLPGSPAEAAGMRPGDVILEVDGEDLAGFDSFTAISRVRGPAGSTVTLTIRREGESEPLLFEIERYKITIPMVEGKLLESHLAYVKINQFGVRTARSLRAELKGLLAQDPSGLILDLRNNPGGFLDAGIQVASQFIDDGPVMIERFGDGTERVYNPLPGGLATDIPLVVLINEGSASASEIVASALQEYERGVVVGHTTYGKGTVQTWLDLSEGNGAVRITFARWLSPNGRSVQGEGVIPDIEVERTQADYETGLDPQLDAAVDMLSKIPRGGVARILQSTTAH